MAILAGSWPTTSPETWDGASQAQSTKANQLVQNCEGLRDTANQLIRQQSGKMIDGMHEMLIRKAGEISDQADSFFALSRGSEEVARLLYGQREDLDKIDRDAHQQIEQIRASAKGFANQMMVGAAIWNVVMAANAQAKGVDAKAAGQITAQAANMGLAPPEGLVGGSPGGGDPGLNLDSNELAGFGGGGRPGPGGMPEAPPYSGQNQTLRQDMGGNQGGAAAGEDPGQGPGDPNQTTSAGRSNRRR